MTSSPSGPVCQEELAGLFAAALKRGERVALAVSGGCDSTALMVLFADFLALEGAAPGMHTVLTVDHRLRPQSAEEARTVADRAQELGFGHASLVWDEEKPGTGLQAAARSARYRLMGAFAQRHGIVSLFTGHTADDQAETLVMRLARGSGLDGLAAMAPTTLRAPCFEASAAGAQAALAMLRIERPLLGLSKARLRATLDARSICWVEDPSNHSPAFERTRVRAALRELEALGLTRDNLALSARRLRRARAALERGVDAFCDPSRRAVAIDRLGFIRIDAGELRACPLEIAIRLLNRAIAKVGGAGAPVALAKLETVAERLLAGDRGAWTLARAKITATSEHLLIEREAGRAPPPALVLAAGTGALWDGRFLVRARAGLPFALEVRALGADGLREVAQAIAIPSAPRLSLQGLPAFCREGRLLAVPTLDYWTPGELKEALSAVFAPLCACNTEV